MSPADNMLAVLDLETGERRELAPGSRPVYSADGYLIHGPTNVNEPSLRALPFSLATLEATGQPFPIDETGRAASVALDGTLVYTDGAGSGAAGQIVVMDRSGKVVQKVGPPVRDAIDPAVSPNGLFVAASVEGDIWVYDLERGIGTRLTSSEIVERAPAWLASSREVTYIAQGRRLANRIADGSVDERTLLESEARGLGVIAWSSDDRYFAYNSSNGTDGTEGGIWYHERGADGALSEAIPYLLTPAAERDPQFSPDGRYLAYHSNESGRFEVYVRPFPLAPGKWQVSTNGGTQPRWPADGKELFYVEGSTLMAVPVSTGSNFTPGQPQKLSGLDSFPPQQGENGTAQYDVFPDSQRFVTIAPIDEGDQKEPTASIRIVQNWYEEFRDRER